MNEIEKCVCGYQYRKDGFTYEGGVRIPSPDVGDEAFETINVNATKGCTIDSIYDVLTEVIVIMCPKCKTLKVSE